MHGFFKDLKKIKFSNFTKNIAKRLDFVAKSLTIILKSLKN